MKRCFEKARGTHSVSQTQRMLNCTDVPNKQYFGGCLERGSLFTWHCTVKGYGCCCFALLGKNCEASPCGVPGGMGGRCSLYGVTLYMCRVHKCLHGASCRMNEYSTLGSLVKGWGGVGGWKGWRGA